MLKIPNVIKLLCALSCVVIWRYVVKDIVGGGVYTYILTRAELTLLIIYCRNSLVYSRVETGRSYYLYRRSFFLHLIIVPLFA